MQFCCQMIYNVKILGLLGAAIKVVFSSLRIFDSHATSHNMLFLIFWKIGNSCELHDALGIHYEAQKCISIHFYRSIFVHFTHHLDNFKRFESTGKVGHF